MSRDALERGYVLHRRDYANSSLLIEIFTATRGRLPVVAKGAKRGRAPLAALLQPFQPLWLSFSGRGEVKTLLRAEAAGPPARLAGTRLYCGFYLNELLLRLLDRLDPHERLCEDYQRALAHLEQAAEVESGLRHFELRLLRAIGYEAVLDRVADDGSAVVAGARYRYIAQFGLRRVLSDTSDDCVSGETLLRLAAEHALTGTQLREARALTRALLLPYLGARPLRSRALFRPSGRASLDGTADDAIPTATGTPPAGVPPHA